MSLERFLQPGGLQASVLYQDFLAQSIESAPPERVGAYRIVGELGRGGMGAVYLAERDDGEYRQRVALKWLDGYADAPGRALFLRERQTLADLEHPGIARLVDGSHTPDGRPWLAMELIEGERIDDHCRRLELPLAQRVSLLLEVCAAVAHAHARGVLHRDLKPSNVMVDAAGRARLLDFGIAQLLGEEAPAAMAAYTPGYASPEQRHQERLTVASDVFQLGRLAATTLTPLALPRDLALILACAAAEAPRDRYPTVDALSVDLRAWLARRPVSVRRHEPLYVPGRFVARHPVGSIASVLTLLLAVTAAVVFTARIAAERDRADERARAVEAVLGFVENDLLAAADPSIAQGREITVREALDRASGALDVRRELSPLEVGSLRLTLGRLYRALGEPQPALSEARGGLAALPPGVAYDRWRRALQLLEADLLLWQDRLEELAPRLAELQAALAPGDRDTAWLSSELGRLQAQLEYRRGNYPEAATRARSLRQRGPLAEAPDSAIARELLRDEAGAERMAGRHGEATRLLEELLARERRLFGDRHPGVLASAHDLGVVLRHQGEFSASLAQLEPVLVLRREVLGASHPSTLLTQSELATTYQELRRYQDAEPLFRGVLDGRRELFGEGHLSTRTAMSNLGLLYALWNRVDDALPLYEHTLELDLAAGDGHHPDTLALIHNLAGLYRRAERWDEALAHHRRAVGLAAEVLGPGSWQRGLFLAGQGLTLQAMGAFEEAGEVLDESVAVLASALGEDHGRTRRAAEMRAELDRVRGEPALHGD